MEELSSTMKAARTFIRLGKYLEKNYFIGARRVTVGITDITVGLHSGEEILITYVDNRYKVYANDLYLTEVDEEGAYALFDKLLGERYVLCEVESWQGIIAIMGRSPTGYPYGSLLKAYNAESVLFDESKGINRLGA